MPDLPRPPRTVRWRAALATWWFLGSVGPGLLAIALVVAFVLLAEDGFRLPRADWRLDAAPEVAHASGEVVGVERNARRGGDVRVRYRFTDAAGRQHEDHGWLRRGAARPGQRAVEYLPADPGVHRLRGGFHSHAASWLPPFAGLLLLPALALTGLWFARVYRTWVVLRHGRAAPATLVALQRLRGRPPRWRVRYAFTGDDGQSHAARQDVRASSPFGRALALATPGGELPEAFAVHAEGRPDLCRLVCRDDVAEARA